MPTNPEQWQIDDAIRYIRLAKFLISKADDKGLTHGEKHYLHQTSGMMLVSALVALGWFTIGDRNLDPEIANIIREPRF